MRCFLAIALPDDVAGRLLSLQVALRAGQPVPRDNLHLTLAFLDDQTDEALQELHEALERLRLPPVPISFGPIGTFGGDGVRSLHVEVPLTPALETLERKLQGALHLAGIRLPHRRFRPHVTLARQKHTLTADELTALARRMAAHAATPLPGFVAQGFGLYRSTLRPGGAVHDLLADYPLRG